MAGYDVFARFYDAVQGDRAEQSAYLRGLLEQHHPTAKTVLELGCGTGTVLRHLQKCYEVSGIDLSEQMLALAADKVPEAHLARGDMTRVSLGKTFDIVICVYDSINHLLDFAQWEEVFDRAREHLDEGGVFVFDINTQRQLATVIDEPPWVHWFGDGNLLLMNVTAGGDDVALWAIRVFEHLGDSSYILHSEDIPEISFPPDRIKASLRGRFGKVSLYDRQRSRPTPRSERLCFVCRV